MRIATTAGLTVTGTTFGPDVIRSISLAHLGTAGAYLDYLLEFHASENAPLQLNPGQAIALVAGATFDAGGTWQASINCDWYEAHPWGASTSE